MLIRVSVQRNQAGSTTAANKNVLLNFYLYINSVLCVGQGFQVKHVCKHQ